MASTSPIASALLFLSHHQATRGKDKWFNQESCAILTGCPYGSINLKPTSSNRGATRGNVCLCWFGDIEMAPRDPIFGINEAFRLDTSERKLNLSVGVYRTEQLQPYVLNVVKKAEKLMLEKDEDKEYLPVEGLAEFNRLTAEVIFGAENPLLKQKKVATIQSLSGTASLRLSAAFIKRFFPEAKVLTSSPTWAPHKIILSEVAVPWSEYRYYDPNTMGLDINGMIADIKGAPNGSFVLLQGCAHNPTGIDPTAEQWQKIADVIQEKNHIPFFDVAYQGFASGCLDEDAYSVRLFTARGMEVVVTQSYSKNLGLYAERIGAVNIVCRSKEAATRVRSQLKWLASPMYASPGAHGARIAAIIVGNQQLMSEWKTELKTMAERIKSVRRKLYDILTAKDNRGKDWSFVLKQKGMFSYTGLNKTQCENMTRKWRVYMTIDGRISVATLSSIDCEYLADAIIDSLYNTNAE